MINWKSLILKTILFCGISIFLILLNVFILFFAFGSGAESSRISELWYVDFLFNYLPLILPSLYLIYIIFKAKKNKDFIKFNTNIFVLFLLIIFYVLKEEFIDLFMFYN